MLITHLTVTSNTPSTLPLFIQATLPLLHSDTLPIPFTLYQPTSSPTLLCHSACPLHSATLPLYFTLPTYHPPLTLPTYPSFTLTPCLFPSTLPTYLSPFTEPPCPSSTLTPCLPPFTLPTYLPPFTQPPCPSSTLAPFLSLHSTNLPSPLYSAPLPLFHSDTLPIPPLCHPEISTAYTLGHLRGTSDPVTD
ncbi:hypothetical protein Pcinc_030482 [Petrolisthes cinctipes]|uniref:Uncharacterized protein n=1 Tax=Petrolisthes cinctipes TaxID=88211 RepID=A0AAE1K4E0_PETCI|nr:hypothetical protein Pcinc_030482 [Petrolisthes cinctipes]